MSGFTQHTTGREVVEKYRKDVNGKTVVITGPSHGSIGGEAVLALAAATTKAIFLCGRSKEKIEPTMQDFAKENSTTKLVFVAMDLMDLESVRAAADTIASQTKSRTLEQSL